MLQQMLGGKPTSQDQSQLAPGVEPESTAHMSSGPIGDNADENPIHAVFNQLAHALSVLSGAADLMLANTPASSNPQSIHIWLRPNARQAEEAMHKLRELRLGPSHAMTELSQCLTILVLAADMLSEGQLSDADANECYELLRRNANRAVSGLYELHAQITPDQQL